MHCEWKTSAESQKSAILSSHFHHKMPWNCHPSQIGHSGWQKILHGGYFITPIIINNNFFPFVFPLVSSFGLHKKRRAFADKCFTRVILHDYIGF